MATLTKKDLLKAIEDMPMNSLIEIKMTLPNISNIKLDGIETFTNSAKEVKCGKYVITISA